MSFTLQLPEGFVFEGAIQFIEAEVIIDRIDLSTLFQEFSTYFYGCWRDHDIDLEVTDYPKMEVVINDALFSAMIVDMNQFGRLILEVDAKVAEVLGVPATQGMYFYVRTRPAEHTAESATDQEGVMLHRSEADPDGPLERDHADAIMAYSYLR
ncbi:MAG: hypothetical protein ACQR33_06990 [Candidatus Saccharibacteria bacterium]